MSAKYNLKSFKENDTYSLVLFALYMFKDNPKYATLSELAYTLDKESLFNLLDLFGGLTITIPKKEELQVVINTLLVYQSVKLENTSFAVALNKLEKMSSAKLNEIKECYDKLCEVLDKHYVIN